MDDARRGALDAKRVDLDVARRASSAGRMLTDAHADMMRRDAVCGGRRAVVTQKLILRELKNVRNTVFN